MVPLSASMASKYILLSILCFFISFPKESSSQKPHNVVVKGRVFCLTCGQTQFTHTNAPGIVGAVVAVECKMKRKVKPGSTSVEGKTGENGEFMVELSPSVVHSQCGVHLVSIPQNSCNLPSIASNHNGVLTYNSPPLSFLPPPSFSCKHNDLVESKQVLLPPLLPQGPPLPLPLPLPPPTPPLPNSPFSFSPLPFSIPFPPLAFPTQPAAPPTK